MNKVAPLRAERAVSKALKLVEPAPMKFKPGQLHAISRAARYLADRALVAASIPNVPDCAEVRASDEQDARDAIALLMEAINA